MSNKANSRKFWLRAMFRVCELTSRELMFALLWLVMGGAVLVLVMVLNLAHNVLLYFGGCLSRQPWNVVAHIVSLCQLSSTIVEGEPLAMYKRGRLHEQGSADYAEHDTRSKLQIPYSLFIANYNNAKRHQSSSAEGLRWSSCSAITTRWA